MRHRRIMDIIMNLEVRGLPNRDVQVHLLATQSIDLYILQGLRPWSSTEFTFQDFHLLIRDHFLRLNSLHPWNDFTLYLPINLTKSGLIC